MLNDARVAAACLYVRTCQRVRNSKKYYNYTRLPSLHPCQLDYIDWENTKVLDREDREYPRQVQEAIYIKKKKPSLNRDQGLELPSLYNGLL